MPVTRWTEADLVALQARQVGPTGEVSKRSVLVTSRVSKRPRYTARPEWFDGVLFGSQAELRRYKDLKLMQDAGAISGLKIHPRYDLHACGVVLGCIELDFEYLAHESLRMVYEDVKSAKKNTSTRTPIWKWKRLHLRVEHGIEVQEIT